jgi:hypothetical protein
MLAVLLLIDSLVHVQSSILCLRRLIAVGLELHICSTTWQKNTVSRTLPQALAVLLHAGGTTLVLVAGMLLCCNTARAPGTVQGSTEATSEQLHIYTVNPVAI